MGGLGGGGRVVLILSFMQVHTQGPHSHILMRGGRGWGRGLSDFFGSVIWPKVFFWVYERCQDFLGSRKKTEGLFGVAKKGIRDVFGYAKKVVIFWADKF